MEDFAPAKRIILVPPAAAHADGSGADRDPSARAHDDEPAGDRLSRPDLRRDDGGAEDRCCATSTRRRTRSPSRSRARARSAWSTASSTWCRPATRSIVCRNGVFGGRMIENVERCGGMPIVVDDEWGTPVDPHKLEDALKKNRDARVVAFVHAETSTGVQSDAKTAGRDRPQVRRARHRRCGDLARRLAGQGRRVGRSTRSTRRARSACRARRACRRCRSPTAWSTT